MIASALLAIGLYGAVTGTGAPYLRAGVVDTAICRLTARYSDVILDAGPLLQHPEIARTIRSYNPGIRIWAYVLHGGYWRNPNPADSLKQRDLPWLIWCAIRDSEKRGEHAVLRNTRGRSLGVNFTSQKCMRALADTMVRNVKGFDGLFLDVSCSEVHGNVAGPDTIDVKRLGWSSVAKFEKEWRKGYLAFMTRLRASYSGPVAGNCGSGATCYGLMNGWMRESFPNQNAGPDDDPWRANMIANQWGQPGVMVQDSLWSAPVTNWITSEPAGYRPETERRMRFGFGSALLCDHAVFSLARKEWEIGNDSAWRWLTIPEYWMRIGTRLTRRELPNGLWEALYSDGADVVNPTPRPVSWYAAPGTRYRDAKGICRQAWSIPPFDALVLEGITDVRPGRTIEGTDGAKTAARISPADAGTPRDVEFALAGANPVVGPSAVAFGIPAAMAGRRLDISIFDLAGRRVLALENGVARAGRYRVAWNEGASLPTGAYFLAMRLGDETRVRRLVLVR
jgi:hypothetical protein